MAPSNSRFVRIGTVILAIASLTAPALSDSRKIISHSSVAVKAIEFSGPALPKAPAYHPIDPNSLRSAFTTTTIPQLGNFAVPPWSIANRQIMRDFFNVIYQTSEQTPIQFTGNISNCNAGTTSGLFQDAVNLRINYHRAMAGVSDGVTLNGTYSAKAQEAALMMSANNALSHFPPSNWTCYTADGDEAAQNSNLSIGNNGWDAVSIGQMRDNGANNTAAGHRRWLIHPPTEMMGTGDVPAESGFNKANSVWVFDNNTSSSGATRDGYVAWPPPGYVPYQVTYPRWSFGLENADFSNATVSMSDGATNIPVIVEALANGIGLNTIVWYPDTLNPNNQLEAWPKPSQDTTYSIALSNVMLDGSPQSFNYDVVVIDPGAQGSGEIVPAISGPASVSTTSASAFSFATIPHAQDYALRSSPLSVLADTEGAESGAANITDGTDADYTLISNSVSGTGSASFHLAHPNASSQWFVWERNILVSSNSSLTFQSRLGTATTDQTAKAQVSLNDGATWADVYSQAGDGGSGEAAFTDRAVSLAAYANKVIKVRFFYEFLGGNFFPQTSNGIGFYVDEILVTNAQELTQPAETSLGDVTQFNYQPPGTGLQLLQVRYFPWAGFAGSDWGPAFQVQASAGVDETLIAASILPTSRSAVVGNAVTAFATIANAGSVAATQCSIAPTTAVPATFTYQETNPATNALAGTVNTPVDIAGGGTQSFVFSFTPSSTLPPTDVALSFDCNNSPPAAVVPGLNTILMSASNTPVPDIIALAAAPGGIVSIPDGNFGVFAVATSNVGAQAEITVSAQAGATSSPFDVLVCETVPATGECLASPSSSVATTSGAGATQTFGFFVSAAGDVPFDPANNRAVVNFVDSGAVIRGSTGVAVCTQADCP